MPKRILFVLSSADKTLTGAPTGWYLPEASHPYNILAPKYDIDFASPKGPNPPVDPDSVTANKADAPWLEDPIVKAKLANAKNLADVRADDYDAVFYVGGLGPVLDLYKDQANIKFATDFYQTGKPTAAVCHGPGALIGATDANGESIYKGRRATALTNQEEEIFGKSKDVPLLVESRLRELGAIFESASEPWAAHVVVDGNLITGQNPASATAVGLALDKALSA